MRKSDENLELLYKAVLTLKNEKECAAFFEDLCTPQELSAIAQRLHVASMLTDGNVYNSIVDVTGASTATISRVNKTLTYQTAGGYKMVFDRMKGKK
ncbi:MAG: YerC/YecD family TrpR-related protein [Oscillospiraceae bacterium]|nr:YerC/YecD family TrpR-related protein [Oscillospiraceae bacterium]